MNTYDKSEPEVADYYADLGVPQHASSQDIKSAWFKLARRHHPDKKAPGKTIDAQEFRKIRAAYDCLKDATQRIHYDALYPHIQSQWTTYRYHLSKQRQYEEYHRAQNEAAQARAAAEADMARRRMEAERQRAAQEAEEARQRMRQERERQAEERSREAARRARERQEQAARERLRREQEAREERKWERKAEEARQRAEELRKRREEELRRRQEEAERRSEAAARRARVEQERVAQERLRLVRIQEKQEVMRRKWAGLRDAAGQGQGSVRGQQGPAASKESGCAHTPVVWMKKNGPANCGSCGIVRKKWAFVCSECEAALCPGCKQTHSSRRR